MPRLSVWMLRAALLHLGLGVTFGSLLLWNKGSSLEPHIGLLISGHMDGMLLGWMVQLVMGTAFWVLPRFSGPARYGRPVWFWLAFGLLNSGVILVMLTPWLRTMSIGRLCELLAALSFAIGIWRRVKPFADGSVA